MTWKASSLRVSSLFDFPFRILSFFCGAHSALSTLPFLTPETLKYLYLLHDPDSEIDILNKHVFNTEAHPMRIFPVMREEEAKESQA